MWLRDGLLGTAVEEGGTGAFAVLKAETAGGLATSEK